MSDDLLKRADELANGYPSTHWQDCWKQHDGCLAVRLAARVRELEDELRIGRQASEIVGTMAMQQKERAERAEAERDALRALLLHTAEQIERCGQHPELLASINAALAGGKHD